MDIQRARAPVGPLMAVIRVIGCAAGGVEQLRNELVAPLLDAGHTVPVALTPDRVRMARREW